MFLSIYQINSIKIIRVSPRDTFLEFPRIQFVTFMFQYIIDSRSKKLISTKFQTRNNFQVSLSQCKASQQIFHSPTF